MMNSGVAKFRVNMLDEMLQKSHEFGCTTKITRGPEGPEALT